MFSCPFLTSFSLLLERTYPRCEAVENVGGYNNTSPAKSTNGELLILSEPFASVSWLARSLLAVAAATAAAVSYGEVS